jgi:hypothetical protein
MNRAKGEHAVFLIREDAMRHFAFSKAIKDKLIAKREESKDADRYYSDVGSWIMPAQE